MSESNKIQLTQPAEERLAAVLNAYREELIDVLEHEKFVPGEDVSEATAADVELAVRRLRQGMTRRVELRRFYAQVMFAMAVVMTAAGFLYPYLGELLSNPTQMILILMGFYTGMAALFINRMMSLRYARDRESTPDLGERIASLERALRELQSGEGSTSNE